MATTLTGAPPWGIARHTVGSTTLVDCVVLPAWARRVQIRNTHGSGTLLVCTRGSVDGAAVGTQYRTIPAGGVLELPLTGGNASGTEEDRTIPLASATASLVAELVFFAGPAA